jgi:hydrogenase maturation protease
VCQRSTARTPNRIVAIGSAHGDDQAGWRALEILRSQCLPDVEMMAVSTPLDVLSYLPGCRALVLLDACQRGEQPGSIVRLTWPLAEADPLQETSSHGLGVISTLTLAESLGMKLPPITLLGVEVAACEPGADLSFAVQQALPELCRLALEEMQMHLEDGRQTARTASAGRSHE